MANKKIKIPIDSSDVKKATKAVEELNQSIDETSSALNDVGVDTGIFDDIKSRVSGAVKGVTNFIKSMRTLKGAIAATGIGLLVVALGSLISYFKNTEKGARTLAIATEAVGVIFGKLQTFAAELGEKIVETFSNPKETISDLKDAIVNNITNRITGLIELFPKLGEAISLTFKGEFKEAAKVSADAIAKVALGVENATDKAVDLGKKAKEGFNTIVEETKNAVTEAAKYVDAQEGLRKAINNITVANANLTKELETQQKIGEDTTRGYEERKIALENAEAAQLKLAQNVARQAGLEEKLLRTDIAKTANVEERRELENQLAQKIAERIDAENSLAQVQLDLGQVIRELDLEEAERKQSIADIVRESNEDSTISKLEAALTQSKVDEEAAIRELELLRATEEEKAIVRSGFERQRQQLVDEANAEEVEKEKQLQKEKQDILRESELSVLKGIDRELKEIEFSYADKLDKLRESLENELITKEEFAQAEVNLEKLKQSEIDAINKEAADKAIEEAAARAEQEEDIRKQQIDAVVNTALQIADTFSQVTESIAETRLKPIEEAADKELEILENKLAKGLISQEAFEQRKYQIESNAAKRGDVIKKKAFETNKKLQIASALIETFKSANAAFNSLASIPVVGVGLGIAAAAAATAAGLANVQSIRNTNFESTDVKPPSSPTSAPTPPSLSLFGSANESSTVEIETPGAGTRQTGFRAYVVESDITNTQNTLNRYKQRSEIG